MDRGTKERSSLLSVLYRVLLYGGAGFLLAVSEATFFARLSILGVVPNVTLAFVVALALFEGEKTGAIAGAALGFAVDALGATGLFLSPPLFMLCGTLCGLFSKKMRARAYLSFLLYMLAAAFSSALCTLFGTAFSLESFSLPDALIYLVVPEFLCTMLFSSAVFLLAKLLTRIAAKFFK